MDAPATTTTATARQRLGRTLGLDGNLAQLLVITVLIFGLMSVLVPEKFLRPYNFESLTYLAPELGQLSVAMMIAMLTGGAAMELMYMCHMNHAFVPAAASSSRRPSRRRRRACAPPSRVVDVSRSSGHAPVVRGICQVTSQSG